MPKHRLMAPYYLQLRDFERRLMAGAIEAAGTEVDAASMLGISVTFMRKRALVIGGFCGHPRFEPPHTREHGSGYPFDRAKPDVVSPVPAGDDPGGEEP